MTEQEVREILVKTSSLFMDWAIHVGKVQIPAQKKNRPIFSSAWTYTLNSLPLFWLAKSVQWIFEISAHDIIIADYTIIMSRTLKVTCNHVEFAYLVLLPISEEGKTWLPFFLHSTYNNTIIRFVFCDIQTNQGLGKGYQPQPSPLASELSASFLIGWKCTVNFWN